MYGMLYDIDLEKDRVIIIEGDRERVITGISTDVAEAVLDGRIQYGTVVELDEDKKQG